MENQNRYIKTKERGLPRSFLLHIKLLFLFLGASLQQLPDIPYGFEDAFMVHGLHIEAQKMKGPLQNKADAEDRNNRSQANLGPQKPTDQKHRPLQ